MMLSVRVNVGGDDRISAFLYSSLSFYLVITHFFFSLALILIIIQGRYITLIKYSYDDDNERQLFAYVREDNPRFNNCFLSLSNLYTYN